MRQMYRLQTAMTMVPAACAANLQTAEKQPFTLSRKKVSFSEQLVRKTRRAKFSEQQESKP